MQVNADSRMAAVRLALNRLGDAPAEVICRFLEGAYGIRIAPRFLPLYRATLQAGEQLETLRRARHCGLPETANCLDAGANRGVHVGDEAAPQAPTRPTRKARQ